MFLAGKTQTDLDRDKAINEILSLETYLRSTDWKASRAFETSQPIDAATLTKRSKARSQITLLSTKYTITNEDLEKLPV